MCDNEERQELTPAQKAAADAEQMVSAIETGGLDARAFLDWQRAQMGLSSTTDVGDVVES